jgi:hypothetical protein
MIKASQYTDDKDLQVNADHHYAKIKETISTSNGIE